MPWSFFIFSDTRSAREDPRVRNLEKMFEYEEDAQEYAKHIKGLGFIACIPKQFDITICDKCGHSIYDI